MNLYIIIVYIASRHIPITNTSKPEKEVQEGKKKKLHRTQT